MVEQRSRFIDLSGNVRVSMQPDGSIRLDPGVITIAEDGSAQASFPGRVERPLRFDDVGRVVGAAQETQVKGLSPELQRTAMFAVLLPVALKVLRGRGDRDVARFETEARVLAGLSPRHRALHRPRLTRRGDTLPRDGVGHG